MNMNKQYQRAFVLQNTGHDFSELEKYCDKIIFLTNGYEKEANLLDTIRTGLADFNPLFDVIVPVGNATANVLLGVLALAEIIKKDRMLLTLAIYKDKEYHFTLFNVWNLYQEEPTHV